MQIIGITGAIGHGKTSLAKSFLRQVKGSKHTESSYLISRVANELNKHYLTSQPRIDDLASINAWLSNLPDILRDVAHYEKEIPPIRVEQQHLLDKDPDFQKLGEYIRTVTENHALIAQDITEDNKESYRPILQWLGGYVTKHISPTLWYDELLRLGNQVEAEGCPLFVIGGVRFPSDGQVIHNAGGKVVAIERPNMKHQDKNDPSEAYRAMVPVDTTIFNDGALGALDHVVITVWKDLQNDDLQSRYQASRMSFDAKEAPNIQRREIM